MIFPSSNSKRASIAELDLQVFAALAEHLPHCVCPSALEVDEDLVRKPHRRMVAGGHCPGVSASEGRVELPYQLGVWMHEPSFPGIRVMYTSWP
jgi:hypothetical protein